MQVVAVVVLMGWLSALGWLGKLVDPVSSIAKELAKAYAEKQNAQTEQARIEANERIKALEARRSVLIAESRHPWNAIARAFLAAPVGIFLWKVIVWDKVLGWGATDDLSQNLWNITFIVVGFYFVDSIASRFRR
jgi:hypothetical protein